MVLDRIDAIDPVAPARFSLLAGEPGEHPIELVEEDRADRDAGDPRGRGLGLAARGLRVVAGLVAPAALAPRAGDRPAACRPGRRSPGRCRGRACSAGGRATRRARCSRRAHGSGSTGRAERRRWTRGRPRRAVQQRVGRPVGRQRAPQRRRHLAVGDRAQQPELAEGGLRLAGVGDAEQQAVDGRRAERRAGGDLLRRSRARSSRRRRSGLVNSSAAFGASSGSPSTVSAEPPRLVHSQPSIPCSRGIDRGGAEALEDREATGHAAGARRDPGPRGRAAACRAAGAAARAARARTRSSPPSRSAAAGRLPRAGGPTSAEPRGRARTRAGRRWAEAGTSPC